MARASWGGTELPICLWTCQGQTDASQAECNTYLIHGSAELVRVIKALPSALLPLAEQAMILSVSAPFTYKPLTVGCNAIVFPVAL